MASKTRKDDQFISFNEAIAILRNELHFPEDRALHFVKRFDKNGDGRLCSTEFGLFKNKVEETKVQVLPKFKEYDRDGNGYVTLDEAAAILQTDPFRFPPDRVLILLSRFDKDGNGKLDIEEFAGFYAEAKALNEEVANHFDSLDKDRNGVLSPEEVVHVIQKQMGFDEKTARHLVKMFDKNQDGSLDKEEFMTLWANIFGQ